MKYLAIDYGKKRMGVASSDSGLVAKPLAILDVSSEQEILDKIIDLIRIHQPEYLIFGLPVDVNGLETEMALEVKKITALINKNQPTRRIYFVNEFLTSVEASQRSGRPSSEPSDDYAAVIILEQFFSQKNTDEGERS